MEEQVSNNVVSGSDTEIPATRKADSARNSALGSPQLRRWLAYLAKALALVAFLFVVSRLSSTMPALAVAIVWAVLSALASMGIAYLVVVRKTHNQFKYREGGYRARWNEGRLLTLLLSFLGAAVLMAGLFFEMSAWGLGEWVLALVAIGLFIPLAFFFNHVEKREWEPLFRTSVVAQRSALLLAALLFIAYLAMSFAEPSAAPISATEAFLNAPQPFEHSPVPLLSEGGKLNALLDGMTTYGLSVASEASPWWYYVLRALMAASSFFGLASLLGTCSIATIELRRVFLPLESAKKPIDRASVVKKYVIEAVAFPVILIIAFMLANAQVAMAEETEEYTWAEHVVRDQVGFVAAYIDGKYYDPEVVQDLLAESAESYEALTAETKEELIGIVNEMCDAQIANIPSYLDWYYSLTADYERLAQFFTGTIEDGMRQQLEERINEGIDGSELDEVLAGFESQVGAIKQDLTAKLEDAEIKDIPEWLLKGEDVIDIDVVTEIPAPTQELLASGQRMAASAGVGAVGGIVIGKVTAKVLEKPFFSQMTSKLASALARKGLISGVASAAGTLVAPGVGTAAGIGIGVLSDYLLVKTDEALNRADYEQEIIEAIEASRAEMIAEIQGL